MKNPKSSIAVRLSVRFTIILAVSIIVLSILFQIFQQKQMRRRQSKDLVFTAQTMAVQLQSEVAAVPEYLDNPDIHNFDIPYFISYVIYNASTGKVLSTNDPYLPVLALSEEKSVQKIIPDYYMDGDLNVLYCTKNTELTDGEKSVPIVIQLSMDMTNDSASHLMQGLPRTILIMLIPIVLISFLALLFITKRTLKPVTAITKAAENISSTNLDTLLPVSSKNDELDYLASTFNSLFQRLKADFDKEHAFTSNVSHELKTPVAVILGQANLLRRWGKDDPAQLEKSLGTIIDEAHSMESVISNLLMMTHMENGTYEFIIEEFKMRDLFEKVKNEFATVAPQMQIDIDSGEEVLKSDKELLRQVLVIIISNSVRYAGKDCKILITGKDKIITVCDNGPGFGEDVAAHVFDRFYRGDKAHNRKDGGSGLGLSIAKTIVEALGGKISAQNGQNGGAELKLILK